MTQMDTARRISQLRELMAFLRFDAVILRNNPDLAWLTGFEGVFDDEEAHTAVVTADGLWLHTDSRYYGSFKERQAPDDPWQIDREHERHPAWAIRVAREAGARCLAVEDTLSLGFYDDLRAAHWRPGFPGQFERLRGNICEMRSVKDAGELERLRRAQQISDDAIEHLLGFIEAGQTEREVRAELELYMLTHGASGLSFDTIVASGPNGANPHARPSERVLADGDMVVIDFGACYGDYHADMTRTVCVGTPGDEERRVYDVVRRAHEEAAAFLRAGRKGTEVHAVAARVIEEAGYGPYFDHGLGHGVGLEIHERPNLNTRWDRPIPEGAVVTVEPGIYLPGRFGVRIEDCGVVTETGYESFTRLSHDLPMVGAR